MKNKSGRLRLKGTRRKNKLNKNKYTRANKSHKKYKLKGGSKKAVVAVLSSTGGFFAVNGNLLRSYIYAKKLNLPFFIEHKNWQYTYKDGWHDYFKSLTVLDNNEQFDSIERFEFNATHEMMKQFTIADFIEAVKETFILNDNIQNAIDSYINNIGGDYTSLYVRRGDKITEMALVPLDDILAQTTITDDGRKIFVQTDDYSIINEMKNKFPSCTIMTLTKENAHGSKNYDMLNWTPEQRKENTEELLMSCVISARATIGWTYHQSNVGIFIKLFGYDNINIYVDDKNMKEEGEKRFKLDYKDADAV